MAKPNLKVLSDLYQFGGLYAYRAVYFDPVSMSVVSTSASFNEDAVLGKMQELKKNGFTAGIETFMVTFDGAFSVNSEVPSAPSTQDAAAIGVSGCTASEDERAAFEAWMRGHCWGFGDVEWDGKQYVSPRETRSFICPDAMRIRMMWAAWRDRAHLAKNC